MEYFWPTWHHKTFVPVSGSPPVPVPMSWYVDEVTQLGGVCFCNGWSMVRKMGKLFKLEAWKCARLLKNSLCVFSGWSRFALFNFMQPFFTGIQVDFGLDILFCSILTYQQILQTFHSSQDGAQTWINRDSTVRSQGWDSQQRSTWDVNTPLEN